VRTPQSRSLLMKFFHSPGLVLAILLGVLRKRRSYSLYKLAFQTSTRIVEFSNSLLQLYLLRRNSLLDILRDVSISKRAMSAEWTY
jgi:hypothetical protein